MKTFIKQFTLRGLCSAAFGPMVLAVIYGALGASGKIEALTPQEVCMGILSITLMAFIAGGITAVYQTESLPLISAILIHGGVLYADYLLIYLLNNWLAHTFTAIISFTLIFAAGYLLIWLFIFWYTRRKTARLNQKLKGSKRS